MFRKMRRAEKKAISKGDTIKLLKEGRRGVLALSGDEGYPYAIPINYLYNESENRIYFHSSLAGHKVDSIRRNPKVCFTVFGEPEIRELAWAPYVRSAVCFGKAEPVAKEELVPKLKAFAMKYYPSEAEADREIAEDLKAVQLFAITVEHMTGKEIQEK